MKMLVAIDRQGTRRSYLYFWHRHRKYTRVQGGRIAAVATAAAVGLYS